MEKKKVVILSIPCYNEEENVVPMAQAIITQFEEYLPQYDYIIQFIDNHSEDGTRKRLEALCEQNQNIRAIFNVRNFGGISSYHGLLQTSGDCSIIIPCDFQVPVDIIPKLVEKWEEGYKIVSALKSSSEDGFFMRNIRSLYYTIYDSMSPSPTIRHFNGVGLYDNTFLDFCRQTDTPASTLTTAVSVVGYDVAYVPYAHVKRRTGKSKANLWALFDSALLRLVNQSIVGPRIATLVGFFTALICAGVGIFYLILKLMFWSRFAAGIAPTLIIIAFTGAVQLFFIGLIGEYIINIAKQISKYPRVVEEKRVNFS